MIYKLFSSMQMHIVIYNYTIAFRIAFRQILVERFPISILKWYNIIMDKIDSYKFTPEITPTEDNAKAIQRLVLQDVKVAGFLEPTRLANPDDLKKVELQKSKLIKQPENYCGFQNENNSLIAYMKTGEWMVGDELPFIKNKISRKVLQISGFFRHGSMSPKEFGIFGLAVDNSIEKELQTDILHSLMVHSVGQAAIRSLNKINIVIHDKDNLLIPIAHEIGFKEIGRRGMATGAPGLIQQRFQLSA